MVSFPIISKGTSWVRVNDIVIDNHNEIHRVKRKGITLANFEKKSWAVAFAVAYCQGEFDTCAELVQANFKLSKYSEELHRYNFQLDNARKIGNILRENIISDRLSRTLIEYDALLYQITPIIKTQSFA